jgi:hypothetical protein
LKLILNNACNILHIYIPPIVGPEHAGEPLAFISKTNTGMKKRTFDIIVILLIAIFLNSLNQFDVLEKSAKFMFIPILVFYFIGQVTERKFKK